MIKLGLLCEFNDEISNILNNILKHVNQEIKITSFDRLDSEVDYLITDQSDINLSYVNEAIISNIVFDTDLSLFTYGKDGNFNLSDIDYTDNEMEFNLIFNGNIMGHYHLFDIYQEKIILPIVVLCTILCLNTTLVESRINAL